MLLNVPIRLYRHPSRLAIRSRPHHRRPRRCLVILRKRQR